MTTNTPRHVPNRIAHLVIRTNKYRAMVDWYRTVLQMHERFSNDQLTFLSFDDEHHRLAIVNMPDLKDGEPTSTAIDHVAFTYEKLGDLLLTYERLKGESILPVHTMNHGPTTSFYYSDPNANMIELQVDNFPTMTESAEYFTSKAFADNPIGTPVNPEVLLRKWREEVPVFDLLRPGFSQLQ